MNNDRLRKLAGLGESDQAITEEYNKQVKEFELLEKMYPGKYNHLNIDTDQISIEEIQKRLEAASRAIGLLNKLKDPEMRKKHRARVRGNLNTIQAALKYMEKQDSAEAA